MNWKAMTKEQQQKVILAVLGGIAVLFIVYRFGISALIESRARAAAELEELKGKLDLADRAIKNESELERQFDEADRTALAAIRDYLPSVDNPLAWTTQKIYSNARELGLDIESVTEVEVGGGGWILPEQAKRTFVPYGVRVSLQGTYQQLLDLVTALERSNPYLAITSININADLTKPEVHQLSLILEWPTWKDPKKAEKPFGAEGAPPHA